MYAILKFCKIFSLGAFINHVDSEGGGGFLKYPVSPQGGRVCVLKAGLVQNAVVLREFVVFI